MGTRARWRGDDVGASAISRGAQSLPNDGGRFPRFVRRGEPLLFMIGRRVKPLEVMDALLGLGGIAGVSDILHAGGIALRLILDLDADLFRIVRLSLGISLTA